MDSAPRPADTNRLEQILEQALDAVVSIDGKNEVTFFNAAAERLWGYSRREVLGQNVRMLVPPIHQAPHDSYVNANRKTGQDKIVGTSRDVEVHRKDGSIIWGRLSLSKVRLEEETVYTAFVRDITVERQQAERIQQTLEQALDAVVSIDERNLVTFFNAAAERLWGYRRQEVIGQNIRMLVPQVHQSSHDSYVNANRETGRDKIVGTSREVEVFRKDGSKVWGLLSLSKVRLGDLIHYTAFVRDITRDVARREDMQVAMKALDTSSNQIEKITTVINHISLQTQLLAINAAIEAAHAGAAGKGFAVVAQEVNNLAQESNRAVDEISNLVVDTKERNVQLARLLNQQD